MEGLAALATGGTDEHDVSCRRIRARLRLYLRDRVLDQTEYSIEIDGQRRAPLLIGHALDGHVLFRPDAVVGDKNVEPAEMADGFSHQRARRFRSIQIGSNRMADARATFFSQRFRLRTCAAITEGNFGPSGSEHTNSGGANAARTARDESDFTGKRKRDGHSRLVSRFPSAVASGGQSPVPEDMRSDLSPRSSKRTNMPS